MNLDIKSELNVQSVTYDVDEAKYIEVVAKPNFPLLGKRLGKRMKEYQAHIEDRFCPAGVCRMGRGKEGE